MTFKEAEEILIGLRKTYPLFGSFQLNYQSQNTLSRDGNVVVKKCYKGYIFQKGLIHSLPESFDGQSLEDVMNVMIEYIKCHYCENKEVKEPQI